MLVPQCLTHRVAMADPSDVSGVDALFDSGVVDPREVVAILGKTEGNGCVNDFTRGYAVASLRALLGRRLGTAASKTMHVPMVMSGGTEGGLSPHFLVFVVREADEPVEGRALAIGVTTTRAFAPHEIGRMSQVLETAEEVRRAMHKAGITSADDVHLVQIKCPLLTQQKINTALVAGETVATEDTYASMGFSRGASALGVALALGEVASHAISDTAICRDHTLWSSRASASAGSEIEHSEIIVLGNSTAWSGPNLIAHGVMRDGIDVNAAYDALDELDLVTTRQLSMIDRQRIKAVIAKAEPSRDGVIRGARHIMWDDSDINPTRHARAVVGGVLAGIIGQTDLFVSGGAEHQGPDGGGPVAIIAARQ